MTAVTHGLEEIRWRVAARATADGSLGASMCAAIASEPARLAPDLIAPRFGDAALSLHTDPYSGEENLVGDAMRRQDTAA